MFTILAIKKFFLGNTLSIVFIGLIIALLAIIIIPNLNQISEKLGFETRTSLKTKLVKEQQNTQVAIDANRTLEGTISVIEKSKDNALNTIEEHHETVKKTEKKVHEIVVKKNQTIAKVLSKEIKSDIPEATVVSKIQITAIWSTFCEFNEDPTCQQPEIKGT